MKATQDAISSTNRIIYELEQINSDYKDLSISVRSYVITGDSMELRHRESTKSRIDSSIDFLENTLVDSLSSAYLDALTRALSTRNETFGEVIIKLRKEKGFQDAQAFYSENDDQELIVRDIPNLTQNIKDRLAVLLDERIKLSETNAQKTVYIIVLGTLIYLGLVFFVIFIFIQDRKKIRLHLNEIEQKKAELQALTNQLQSHNARLLNFSHLTSHNLRSPVNNLNSLLQLYQEAEEPSEKDMFFGHIERVTRHLTETLNELMEALKIQEENAIEREWLNFEEIFQKTIETFSADILMSGALVTRDFTEVKKVEYNRSYLESIMLNLLSNAIKYKASDRVPRIHFETFISGGSIGLKVRDNGQGIDLEKYGEKLFGLNNTFHGHAEGRGVGLYLVKTQLASQGGSISVKSKVGAWTEFRVLLF
ncbi:ATP-binding protein [Cyclobacterium sp.]|uniref:sensor histidine kinase n=1 Tax=Cyclobacterium sp. TaxID=1966343 RepID=UPI0019B60200|nr:ATP-binding protein [Cyclobacterium sp.]MBD3628181.1 CHASE3 domain-containing protein [Cyclobacterium sp.]